MNLGFHQHQWEPYHITEILYMPVRVKDSAALMCRDSHLRLFECCLICGIARVKNLAPGEIPPFVCNVEES